MMKPMLMVSAMIGMTVFAGEWVKDAGGPVLGNAELGTCFDVNVVTDGPAPYTMYFSWRPKKAIAYVRSDDGVKWTQTPEICLEANPESGWEDLVNRSVTVKKDGVWHMWYTGQVFTNENGREGWSRIGYATSTNGVNFTRVRREPVMTPELGFEKTSVMNPYVRWDEKRGVWRMWYAAGEIYEPNVLGYAESKDGLAWKKRAEPIFGHGDAYEWDRDRVGACEVHPLPDGRWVMFYIGYSDIDTARIGAAVSDDGITGWRRLRGNPLVSPDLGEWDSCACYKPSVLRDERNGRWRLWYNGRSGSREYVGAVTHAGLDLESVAVPRAEPRRLLAEYVGNFNAHDEELYTNAFANAEAESFLAENAPLFACPDRDIERTYYFRWWTFRKHLRRDLGNWIVSEFLPDVDWAGAGNAIVCPAGHHFREGRWLRDPKYLEDLSRFWLADERVEEVRRRYCSWLLTGVRQFAEVSGKDGLPAELLDAAVANFRKWEEGDERRAWPKEGKARMGGDGKGGFLSIDNYEGSELSLGSNGYRPLMGAAMWREALTIAETARAAGRADLADEFARKAELAGASLMKRSWNPALGFFTTGDTNGAPGTVRELNGYAPWYFGLPTGVAPDWSQLVDPQGFGGFYGLTFPERRAKGFVLAYEGHECQWNGPSWPYSTSIALTALANDVHASPKAGDDGRRRTFVRLLRQYAAAQRLTLPDGTVAPWIDENMNPDTGDWIARTCLMRRKDGRRERGKDYNHSTFCDLVISGLVGFRPKPDGSGFTVDPTVPDDWDYLTLERIRYRGHDVDVRWRRGAGFTVDVDGKRAAESATLGRLDVVLPAATAPYAVSWRGEKLELGKARISKEPFCRVWPGHQRDLSQTEISYFARFDAGSAGTLRLEGAGVGREFRRVLPLSDAFAVRVLGDDALELAIAGPRARVIEFGSLPTLHVFADAPLPPAPAPGPGGRVIRFAKGEHRPGVVAPKSGDVVVLDEGAVVYGALAVVNATNVTVTGRGIFDGSELERADESLKAFHRRLGLPEIDTESACFAYSVLGSENVTISGVTFRDPPFWTLVIRNQCRNTLIDGIHIVGNWRYNSDGIDVCASADTVIRNSFARTYDDCMVARGPYLKGEYAPVSDLVVSNCDFYCDWGQIFKAQVQDFHGSTIERVTMRDCRFMAMREGAIFLAVRYGSDLDVIRDLVFEDLELDYFPQTHSLIQNRDEDRYRADPIRCNSIVSACSYTLGRNLDNQRNAPMEKPEYYRFLFENFAFRRFRTFGEKRGFSVDLLCDVPRHEIRGVVFEDLPEFELNRRGSVSSVSVSSASRIPPR